MWKWTALPGVISLSVVACSGQQTRPATTVTLAVNAHSSAPPDIRVAFSPSATIEQAEQVQTRLSGLALGAHSVLRSPFRALDIKITAGDPGAALGRLRTLLRDDHAVSGVDACPCPVDRTGPDKTEVRAAQFMIQRSCASAARPVPVYGCVTDFELIGKEPVEDCAPHLIVAFEARARQVPAQRVHELKGRVTTAASFEKGAWTPGVGASKRLTPDDHTVRGELRGHYFSIWAYREDIDFSPGDLVVNPFPPDAFSVSTRPVPEAVSPVRLKGALGICGREPASSGAPYGRYEVVVEVSGR